jgi:outer membrane lipoprotein-sorting protein
MFMTRLKIAVVLVLTLTLVGTSVGVLTYPLTAAPKGGPAEQPADLEPPRSGKPKPAPADTEAREQPRPEPPPPALNPERLDEVLRRWHKAVADVEKAVVHLSMTQESSTFGETGSATAVLKYRKPNRILFESVPKSKSADWTRVLFTGSHVYLYLPTQKTIQAIELASAKDVAGFGIPDPSDPFPFDIKPEEARKRFDVKLAKEDQWYSYLEFVPLLDRERADVTPARVVLNKDTALPRQLWFEAPNGHTVTWDVTKIDTNVTLNEDDFRPAVPAGWEILRQKAPAADPKQAPPPNNEATPKPSGDRLERLLQELLESKRSDEQVFEALCLATLGRLPTDTEKKLVLGTVAKHKDRKEAFVEVLTQLTGTREFSAHVEALGKRDPRRRPSSPNTP